MHRDFTLQRRLIVLVLSLLIAADLGLGFYSWQLSAAPHTTQKDLDKQNLELQLLKGDVQSAQQIKDEMPSVRKDCDKFEQSLPPQSEGYSAIISELNDVVKKSGLQIVNLTTKPKELPERGMEEVEIEATVNGDYGSIVRLVNGLQRSHKFYIVDGLALSTDSQMQKMGNAIRLAFHVRTYFRQSA
jgi:Tfp pilus assembly protein PilO